MKTQNSSSEKLTYTYEELEPARRQTDFGLKYYQVGTFNSNWRS